jgi:hypothetical protein
MPISLPNKNFSGSSDSRMQFQKLHIALRSYPASNRSRRVKPVIRQTTYRVQRTLNFINIRHEQLPVFIVMRMQLAGFGNVQEWSSNSIAVATININDELHEVLVQDATLECDITVPIREGVLDDYATKMWWFHTSCQPRLT